MQGKRGPRSMGLDEMKLVGDDVVGECCHERSDGLVSSGNKVEAVLMY